MLFFICLFLIVLNISLGIWIHRIHKQIQESKKQLFQAAQGATLGEIAASMTHEMNNALQLIMGFNGRVEIALERQASVTKKDVGDFLKEVDMGVERIAKLIANFRRLARDAGHSNEKININEAIESSFILLNEQFRHRCITVEKKLSPQELVVFGNRAQFQLALLNIVTFFRDLFQKQDESAPRFLQITSEILMENERKTIRVIYKNNGPPLSDQDLKNIFNPNYEDAIGLKLSSSRSVLERAGGQVQVHSNIATGTQVIIEFANR